MTPYFLGRFGNPHAEENLFGQAAAQAVGRARAQIADALVCDPRELIFTSGATEANNLLIQGTAKYLRSEGRSHIITSVTEHKSVLEAIYALKDHGFTVTVLPVDAYGLISIGDLEAAMTPKTGLVSIMAANNEIGVLQPIASIADVCRSHGALFHTDAAQAVGKVELDLSLLHADLLSLSGHKVYGPMGIGTAFIRRSRHLRFTPTFHGGGQERGIRPGTVPLPLVVGLGKACEIASDERSSEADRLTALRDRLLKALDANSVKYAVNGSLDRRLPGNLNLSFDGVDAEALLMTVRSQLALSTGSACTASSLEPSHVVAALGLGDLRTEGAVRIGLGRMTTAAEVDAAAAHLSAATSSLLGIRYNPKSQHAVGA